MNHHHEDLRKRYLLLITECVFYTLLSSLILGVYAAFILYILRRYTNI